MDKSAKLQINVPCPKCGSPQCIRKGWITRRLKITKFDKKNRTYQCSFQVCKEYKCNKCRYRFILPYPVESPDCFDKCIKDCMHRLKYEMVKKKQKEEEIL